MVKTDMNRNFDENYYLYNQAIYEACFLGSFDAVQVLIDLGGDPNYQCEEEDDFSLLHVAAANQDINMVAMLLEMGANPDIENQHGQTPWDISEDEIISNILEKASDTKFYGSKSTH
jgi:ankyrin repeat protein